jgi:hypothetical protein
LKSVRLIVALSLISIATVASAQATRTWVSGVGSDANPCSRTAPCQTFAGALSKTAAGGEIDALDPHGFGTVTINKSITIDGGGGQVASILYSGINGVTVNDALQPNPQTIEVTLRNLRLNGAGTTLGVDGVRFLSGKRLTIENCIIQQGSGDGIEVANTVAGDFALIVRNTNIENFGTSGINVHPPAGATFLVNVNNCNISDITSSSAIILNGQVRASISNTEIVRAPMGAGVAVLGGADVSLNHVTSHNNQFGVLVAGPATAVVRLKDSLLHGTSNSVSNTVGATVTPFSSNVLIGPQVGVGVSQAAQ